jgi:hypothetical protein
MAHLARQDQRIKDVVWLRVCPEVIRLKGIMITNGVSNKSGIVPRPITESIGELDLDVLYNRMDWRLPEINRRLREADKYEILVPKIVPL